MIGALSEDVKLYMKLLTANRYYALNDRAINLLSQGEVDMSATTDFTENAAAQGSDSDLVEVVHDETEVGISVVDQNKTRAGGAFFKYLNCTLFNIENMVYLRLLRDTAINITVCI